MHGQAGVALLGFRNFSRGDPEVGHLRSMLSLVTAGLLLLAATGSARAEGDYMLQLASVTSEAGAQQEWKRLQGLHAELLADMPLTVQVAEVSGKGTVYRLQTGPFPNRVTADDFCWQLRAEKGDCLVVKR